jgi:hypothetical protein
VGVDYAMSHVQDIISGVRRVTIGGMIIIALLASWTISASSTCGIMLWK